MAGKGEDEFANLMNRRGVWTHKQKDVMRCPKCFSLVYQTNRTEAGDDREVKASLPDYQLIVLNQVSWAECKFGTDSFHFEHETNGIRAGQYRFMADWMERGVKCWLYLSIGPGRAPKDRYAYLIPWEKWMEVEQRARDLGMKSIPFRETIRKNSHNMNIECLFPEYKMDWVPGVGWSLPNNHVFVDSFPSVLALKSWREYASTAMAAD